jgi:hypothetical protein
MPSGEPGRFRSTAERQNRASGRERGPPGLPPERARGTSSSPGGPAFVGLDSCLGQRLLTAMTGLSCNDTAWARQN